MYADRFLLCEVPPIGGAVLFPVAALIHLYCPARFTWYKDYTNPSPTWYCYSVPHQGTSIASVELNPRKIHVLNELCNNTLFVCPVIGEKYTPTLSYAISLKAGTVIVQIPLSSEESGSIRIASSHTKDGENETSEMWRNSIFPVGILFSQVELGEGQPGARCLHQASAEWRRFPFGTKVGALSQAVPWKLLHKPVSSQPLVCHLPHLLPVRGVLGPGFQQHHLQN